MAILRRIKEKTPELTQRIEEMDLDYDYPGDRDWKPGSELHDDMVDYLLERIEASRRVTEDIMDEWEKLDWTLNAYVPLTTEEKKIKAKDWDAPVATVVPMTFASLETFLTYMTSTFIRSPIHRFKGYGSKKAIIGNALLEKLISRQNGWFKEGLRLTTMWRDAFTYGIGVVSPTWSKHKARRAVDQEVTGVLAEVLGSEFGVKEGDLIRYLEEQVVFEGNELQNLDVYNLLLDPKRSPNDIQKSEFIGWLRRTDAKDILDREFDPEERRFNGKAVRVLAENGQGVSRYRLERSDGRNTRQGTEWVQDDMREFEDVVDEITLCIKVIPEALGLGDEGYPQRWLFTLAGDRVITQAQPLELDHGMWPVACCAPNTDGYSVLPVSHLATTYGLQQAIDWFIRSHTDNVRKAINDMLIVDPSAIETDDLLNPGPGKLVRLKRTHYNANNRSLDAYVKQLPVADVTRGHAQDAGILIDLLRQANGTVDIAMGNLSRMPERPTATGIDAAKTGALSRLQRLAIIIGQQAMSDIAWQEAYNTLQFMDQETAVSITGRSEQMLRREYGLPPGQEDVMVSPFDLDPNFDVVPHDGTMPPMENVQAWTQILQTMLGVDGVAQEIIGNSNIMGIFQHWARIAGAQDVTEFIQDGGNVQMQTMSDEPGGELDQQVQAGNFVPIQELAG